MAVAGARAAAVISWATARRSSTRSGRHSATCRAPEGGRERNCVAGLLGRSHRFGAESLGPSAVGRVVELDREPRLHTGAQGEVLDALEGFLEPGDRRGVEVDDRDPESGEAERRLREKHRDRRLSKRERTCRGE